MWDTAILTCTLGKHFSDRSQNHSNEETEHSIMAAELPSQAAKPSHQQRPSLWPRPRGHAAWGPHTEQLSFHSWSRVCADILYTAYTVDARWYGNIHAVGFVLLLTYCSLAPHWIWLASQRNSPGEFAQLTLPALLQGQQLPGSHTSLSQ